MDPSASAISAPRLSLKVKRFLPIAQHLYIKDELHTAPYGNQVIIYNPVTKGPIKLLQPKRIQNDSRWPYPKVKNKGW